MNNITVMIKGFNPSNVDLKMENTEHNGMQPLAREYTTMMKQDSLEKTNSEYCESPNSIMSNDYIH